MSTRPAPETLARIDRYIRGLVARHAIPGAAFAVVEGGETLLAAGIGTTACKGGRPVSAHTLFRVGSVTKPITAVAVLQLAERGLIDLDAPVARYLPWFRTAGRTGGNASVTVRHLLNQTSGLPYSAWKTALADPSVKESLEAGVRALGRVPLLTPPGTKWAYANANYDTLGQIVAAVSGRPYPEYVSEQIFRPLGMGSSTFDHRVALDREYAHLHTQEFGRPVELPVDDAAWLAPSGLALFSSVTDMARFVSSMLGAVPRPLLSAATLAEAQRGHVATMVKGVRYGLGWMRREFHGESLIFHEGLSEGSNAIICLLPERNLGFVFLAACFQGKAALIGANVARMLQGAAGQALEPALLFDSGAVLNGVGAVLGTIGLGLLAALVRSLAVGSAPGTAGASAAVLLAAVLWALPWALRRSYAFPLPAPIGIRTWPVEVAAGWRTLLLGANLWAVYALAAVLKNLG
jgi:CubicO group peptidase (beta-lactamase class C family)